LSYYFLIYLCKYKYVSNLIRSFLLFTFQYCSCEFNMSLCEVPNQSQSISEVSPQKENWNIIARVIHSWFVPDFTKQRCPFSMEFVIQDKEVIIIVILEILPLHLLSFTNFYELNSRMLNIFILKFINVLFICFRVLKYMLQLDVL